MNREAQLTDAFCELNMLLMGLHGSIILHKGNLHIQLIAYKYGQIFISVTSEAGRRESNNLHNSFEKQVNKFNDKKWANFETSDTDFILSTQLSMVFDAIESDRMCMIMGISERFDIPCSLDPHWVKYSSAISFKDAHIYQPKSERRTFLLDIVEFCLTIYKEECWFKFDNNKIPANCA